MWENRAEKTDRDWLGKNDEAMSSCCDVNGSDDIGKLPASSTYNNTTTRGSTRSVVQSDDEWERLSDVFCVLVWKLIGWRGRRSWSSYIHCTNSRQHVLARRDCCEQGRHEEVVAVIVWCTVLWCNRRSLCSWFCRVFYRQDRLRPCDNLHNAAVRRSLQCEIDARYLAGGYYRRGHKTDRFCTE